MLIFECQCRSVFSVNADDFIAKTNNEKVQTCPSCGKKFPFNLSYDLVRFLNEFTQDNQGWKVIVDPSNQLKQCIKANQSNDLSD